VIGGLSARSVNHLHRVLRQALKQAVLWRALADNPAAQVKPPKPDHKEMTTIDAAQTADVIETARGTGMLIPILLGVTRGLRRGEVVALRWRSGLNRQITAPARKNRRAGRDAR